MKQLIVLLGPTGVGKTALSLNLAEHYHSPIISADSRQFFKGLEIGTAAPTTEQLSQVRHFLVGMLGITDYYSASEFERDALDIIAEQHKTHDVLVATGGSMMYIDALCNGIDDVPTIDEGLRKELYDLYEKDGLEPIRAQLKTLDPDFYNIVDLRNYKRVIHALEVCLMTGKPYSSFRTNTKKPRPFNIVKIGLMREREQLYERINRRVDEMMLQGLLYEAKQYYPQRQLNSLNTVGYKELFKYFDGEWTLDFAIDKIKQNSRIYSRKQMTWFKRDKDIHWINLSETTEEEALQRIISIAGNHL
ncbi:MULTISPECIES: tRNA (adenosine(37)-N6)-dimethylallyltransferase MiaA [unclassified Dysgonomonas]|jgi:tRNA dimethylallyltransferase|uniref:tRNA (adenosine(37)-N6)-dimethylallyltransferase MiaA n=1 Tax=unclassified Dysgonomonas TaxID=2630389 RepID=UPI0025C13A4C|nr:MULTISPECIES: tRNA (adenosine(37)-N6)-dimethylallyltransferase MiaA [unclassified Dysgonomonas]MDR2004966.1 tRNA (adenosine(37)-N6)-dimethylallyltransferase MiaA [Prevotella sp.]HMM01254.1 tRNA (adenosine(37)-N6)-dimethylallyltransferase MiaA [Dysgonomonas sp.]